MFLSALRSSTPVGVTTSGQMPPPQVQSGRMARAQGAPRSPRYGLCANLLFDVEQDMLEATFEVPGVKRDDIRVKLHECPFSRVKQLTVFGLSRPMPAGRGHSIRQRKAGEFMSSITVFPDTKVRANTAPSSSLPSPRALSFTSPKTSKPICKMACSL